MDSWDDVAAWLRERRVRQGSPSYAELARRVREVRSETEGSAAVAPSRMTVYDCFRSGRRRMDLELVSSLARALGLDPEEAAAFDAQCFAVQNHVDAARVVSVTEDRGGSSPFVGRESELARLGALAGQPAAIVGMPGVGKSSLALEVGRRWAKEGPGRRVVVAHLRGFHATRPPADGAAVLAELHRVLDSPLDVRLLPAEEGLHRLGQYLSEQRTALVLDDAVSAEQLQPVLPDTDVPVLVTSRNDVTSGLPVRMHREHLGLLAADEAAELLAEVVGRARLEAEPTATAQLVEHLGGLPLSLHVTGSRVAAHPGWLVADHVAALEEHLRMLRLPQVVEETILLSYRTLPDGPRALLRTLAQQPCRRLHIEALATMVGTDVVTTREHASCLVTANLVDERGDRLALHDVVRVVAAAAAVAEDPPSMRARSRAALLEHLWEGTREAISALGPAVLPRVAPETFSPVSTVLSAEAAQAWLVDEIENLLTLADPAESAGRPGFVHDLSSVLGPWLESQARLTSAIDLHRRAYEAARQASDLAAQARAGTALGSALVRAGQSDDGVELLVQALRLLEETTDPHTVVSALSALAIHRVTSGALDEGEALAVRATRIAEREVPERPRSNLLGIRAVIAFRQGEVADAAFLHRQAYERAVVEGDEVMAAIALSNEAECARLAGDPIGAERAAREAYEIALRSSADLVLGPASSNLAAALCAQGRHEEALEAHGEAIRRLRATGDVNEEASALNARAVTLEALGRREEARQDFVAAGVIAARTGNAHELAVHEEGLARLQRLPG